MALTDRRWKEIWEEGRTAWPNVEVSVEDFLAHARRCEDVEDPIKSEIVADLYLAAGCAAGCRGALEAFEHAYLPQVDGIAARLGRRGVGAKEARQAVRMRLFVGDSPRIREYRGRGSLRGWLRVVATRTMLNLTEARRHQPHRDIDDLALIACEEDPELALVKQRYRAQFRDALWEAAQSLDTRERALIRLALIQGLTVDALGDLYDVHRSTAARWVQSAHRKLAMRVRSVLRAKTRMNETELESVLRVAASGLDTCLGRYFETQAEGPDGR